jgi:predicted nucleotidyltransferase component of viral defense system
MPALTDLQDQVLRRFFDRRDEFFLTGGAALAGFHLHHRVTHDLDFFTSADAIDEGERTLRDVAESLSLDMETLRRSPDFRRFLLQGASEGVIVDLVKDASPQVLEKMSIGRIVVDSPREILANKLCALLSRTEVRDLVDVARLEEAGFDPIAALHLAAKKDAGMTAGQLAWVLSGFPIPADEALQYGMPRKDLHDFRESFVRKLTAAAFPGAVDR